MTTLNISLPDSMRAFIDEQIAQGGYSTASEYIRDLIRQAQKQAAQEKLDNMLLEGLASGEPIEVTDQWWQKKQERLNQLRRQQS
ncbi:MAG: type II toxin-antitoxin system ParD family antitoxin [Pleurocapsa sp. MO_192.B19]|nr:type II toxin-antitoxin system ParD family antitoxin [Pleurocapsa sp. MO_192.B19]